jgi:hypothetical protein
MAATIIPLYRLLSTLDDDLKKTQLLEYIFSNDKNVIVFLKDLKKEYAYNATYLKRSYILIDVHDKNHIDRGLLIAISDVFEPVAIKTPFSLESFYNTFLINRINMSYEEFELFLML